MNWQNQCECLPSRVVCDTLGLTICKRDIPIQNYEIDFDEIQNNQIITGGFRLD